MTLAQAFPAMRDVKEFRNKVGLFSADRSVCYDVVSPRYQLVEHGAAIAAIQDAFAKTWGKGAPELAVRTMANGARMVATARLPIPHLKLAKGDVTAFSMTVHNSYDRSSVFRAEMSGTRLVCTNGMQLGAACGAIRQAHVGISDGTDTIVDQLGRMIHRAPMVKRLWEQWADIRVSRDEARDALAKWLPAVYATPILEDDRWTKGRSAWEFYNDLTHMSSHLTKGLQRRMDFEETIAAMFYGSKQPAFLDAVEDLEPEEA